MSFAKKGPRPRNRRVSNVRQRRQQHLLDVKVRSRSATQHRNRRILVIASKLALALALCFGIYLGAREGAKRFFFDNPDYRLSKIDVQTDGSLPREQILQTAGLREGENIFRVNLASVRDALQQLPQVDDAQVLRKLPGEIDVKVLERKPIAWITAEKQISDPFASDAAFLVDVRGVLMKEKKLLPEYLALPLISGCKSESLEPGKIVESVEAKGALELLRLSAGSFMQTRFQIREIDLSKGYCLLVTDKTRAQVTFGFDNLETQLQRLEKFLVYCDDSKQELATVNLLVQRNIPATFAKSSVDVINETIDPTEVPRVMKAIPLHQPGKLEPFSAPKPSASPLPANKTSPKKLTKPHASPSATEVRRAVPNKQKKKSNNDE
jgi:cell division septal protein FtsQ